MYLLNQSTSMINFMYKLDIEVVRYWAKSIDGGSVIRASFEAPPAAATSYAMTRRYRLRPRCSSRHAAVRQTPNRLPSFLVFLVGT